MASGKTTIGHLLAARLDRPFVDNDVLLEERTGCSAREIADAEGADALHRQEAEALVGALASPDPAVIAAAAAAPLEPAAARALADHDVVYLRAEPAVLAARLARDAGAHDHDDHRPFVADDARGVIEAQFRARDEPYRALATVTVDVADSPEEVVDEISAALGR